MKITRKAALLGTLLLCIFLYGCTPQRTVAADAADTTAIERLEALGVTVAPCRLPLLNPGVYEHLLPSFPRLVSIPDVPFGIVDEASLDILMDAMEELILAGADDVDFSGVHRRIVAAGLLDYFNASWMERRLALMSAEEYEFFRRTDALIARQDRVSIYERNSWPSLINDEYIAPLEEVGLQMVLPLGQTARIQIAEIPGEPFGITDEAGLRILLTALEHLADIGYAYDGILIRPIPLRLHEAGLWHSFVEMAQYREKARWHQIQPQLQQLKALGVVVTPVFQALEDMTPRQFGYCNASHFCPRLWEPLYVRVALHPYNAFTIEDDAHLAMLAEAMNFDYRVSVSGFVSVQHEILANGLWERFDAAAREARISASERAVLVREQRFGIQ